MKIIIATIISISLYSVSYAKTFTSKGLNNDFSNGLLVAQNDVEEPQMEDQSIQEIPEQQDYQEQAPEIEQSPPQEEMSVENDY